MKRRIQEILLVLFAIAILVLPLGPALPGQAAAGAFAYADTNVDEAYDDGTEGEWNLEEEAPEEEADGEVEVLDLPDERLTERLTDDADLLTNAEEKELLAKLDEISERQKMDVVVVTTNGLDGKTATEYADDFFDYNGFGFGAGHDGILLLVSMEERDWAISTSGAGIDTFTDDGQSFMTGQIIPYLSSGAYAGAFDTYATLCDEFITQAKEGDPYDGGNMPKDPEQTRSFRLLMLPVSILIGFFASLMNGKRKQAKQKTVRHALTAMDYMVSDSLRMQAGGDRFLRAHTATRHISRPKNSGGGGHGSSTHMGSSGHVHGGSSGKF